jgi:uncharacterized protein Yka (UPF0111/DUF47 family)
MISQSQKAEQALRELLDSEKAADRMRRKVKQQLRAIFHSGPAMTRDEQLRFFAELYFDGVGRE